MKKNEFPVSKVRETFSERGVERRKYEEGKLKSSLSVKFEEGLRNLQFSEISFEKEATLKEQESVIFLREKIKKAFKILTRYENKEPFNEIISKVVKNFPLISLNFLSNHHHLLSGLLLNKKKVIFQFDLDIATEARKDSEGLSLLYALGIFYEFSSLINSEEKENLLKILSFYEVLKDKERRAIEKVLSLPELDTGGVFLTFLKEGEGKDTLEKQRITTWLRARNLFPLPYNREAVRKVIDEEKEDLASLRKGIYEKIRDSYIEEIDTELANRISDRALEEGRRLVCGRFSRAFYIDALLMANAKMINLEYLEKEILGLEEIVKEKELLLKNQELDGEKINCKNIRGELQAIVNLLAWKEVSLSSIEGVLEKFRKALRELEGDFLGKIDEFQRRKRVLIARQIEEKGKSEISTRISSLRKKLLQETEEIREKLDKIELTLSSLPQRDPVFMIFFQRLFEIDAIYMGLLNELKDPFFGEDEEIQKLLLGGGHNIYVTPNMKGWLRKCDDWIEALPAYASYQIIPQDGSYKFRAWVQRSILEEMYRRCADDWALNIEEVMNLEHITLAREIVAKEFGLLRERKSEEEIRRLINKKGLFFETSGIAAIIEKTYLDFCDKVAQIVEKEEISRFLALKRVIEEEEGNLVKKFLNKEKTKGNLFKDNLQDFLKDKGLEKRAKELLPLCSKPRRPLPNVHVLTTLGPGESEFNVKNWLEEAMLLFNICRAYNLEEKVREKTIIRRKWIMKVGEKVISELDLKGELYKIIEEDKHKTLKPTASNDAEESKEKAIFKILLSYPEVSREVAKVALLLEKEGKGVSSSPDKATEPEEVLKYISLHPEITKEIEKKIARENNLREEKARVLIEKNPDLKGQRKVLILSRAREELIKKLGLEKEAKGYLKSFLDPSLSKLLTRREVIVEEGLLKALNDARFRYEATGPFKKYNLLYTPSRVDLGAKEVDSVKNVPKWVGGIDNVAANAGLSLYSLYNVGGPTAVNSTRLAEFLKVGENFFSRGGVYYLSLTAGINLDTLRIGDFEFFREQWNMRGDRIVLPSGETYGGFCVPKEFSLLYAIIIGCVEKSTSHQILTSFGIPEEIHPQILKDLRKVLSWRVSFHSLFDWEQEAIHYLNQKYPDYFKITKKPFYLSRLPQLAQTLNKMGIISPDQEERDLSFKFTYWVNKKAQGLEEINRTGPFRKVHLIYRLIKEARQKRKDIVSDDKIIGVMCASYKEGERKNNQEIPISDVRFSAGARKLEIYAGVAENHILLDLDPEGRKIIKEMFKGFIPPADIRIVGTSTGSDILNHVPNSGLEEIKDEVKQKLQEAGLDENLIRTNCLVYGGDLEKWVGIRSKPLREREKLVKELKGKIHLLVVDERGPFRRYEEALQGVDFVDLGIPDPELLDLIDNLPRFLYLMKRGRPQSALVFADGTSGARRPTFAFRYPTAKRKVKELFALEERAVYGCLGIGEETIKSWREEMIKDKEEAKALLDNLFLGKFEEARKVYTSIRERLIRERRAEEAVLNEIRAKKMNLPSSGERFISEAYSRVIRGLNLSQLDFGTWLILGGIYLVNGKIRREELEDLRNRFEEAVKKIPSQKKEGIYGFNQKEVELILKTLFRPLYLPSLRKKYREISTGLAGSLKAVEEKVSRLEKWEARRRETARIFSLRQRKRAFLTGKRREERSFTHLFSLAKKELGKGDSKISEESFGRFLALSRDALYLLYKKILKSGASKEGEVLIEKVFSGGEIATEDYLRLSRYFTKEAELLRGKREFLEEVARGLELLDISLLLEKTSNPQNEEEMNTEIARFFDLTINSHIFDYLPYHYHRERGAAFESFSRREKFLLAEKHHRWLYTYIRYLLITYTPLSRMDKEYQDEWLGNADKDLPGFGIRVDEPVERFWFNYARLRDTAVLRHEGYPFPEILQDVDPYLLYAKERVNIVIVYPVGNTTVPVALEQGPYLAKEDKINLFLSSFPEIVEKKDKKFLYLYDGIIYLGEEDYQRIFGKSCSQNKVFCALSFKQPLLAHGVFFHFTHPLRPEIDKVKVPLIQPLVWEAATHLKCELPRMLEGSGVGTPDQRNWYLEDTKKMPEEEAKEKIEKEITDLAQKYPNLIVKPEKESGGRKAEILPVKEGEKLLPENIKRLRDLVYEISQTDNVVIQEVLESYVRRLYTREFLEEMVERFARIGIPVLLDRDPQTPLFSYFRQILVAGKEGYKISHHITVISTQGIANVGQGGLLYEYKDEIINPKYREDLRREITRAAFNSLQAQKNYLKANWKYVLQEYLKIYPEFSQKIEFREMGNPDDIPYEMGDYMPVFLVDEEDNLIFLFDREKRRLLPLFTEKGEPTKIKIFDEEGKPLPRKDSKGKVLTIPMFDKEGKRIRRFTEKGEEISTLVVFKIEANPGAGLWRPHNDQLPPERKGEGVSIIFRSLGERAKIYREKLLGKGDSPHYYQSD